jgi:hypothetical protein
MKIAALRNAALKREPTNVFASGPVARPCWLGLRALQKTEDTNMKSIRLPFGEPTNAGVQRLRAALLKDHRMDTTIVA